MILFEKHCNLSRRALDMVNHLLAIDDVKDDFYQILTWAIEFKRLWKQGDEVALNFMPLDTMTIG